jgi:hypothetical protein
MVRREKSMHEMDEAIVCPYCRQNDLLISLNFVSALDDMRDKDISPYLMARFEDVEELSGGYFHFYPETCPQCGSPVSLAGGSQEDTLHCEYCGALLVPSKMVRLPKAQIDRERIAQMRASTFIDLIQRRDTREEGFYKLAKYLNIVEEPTPSDVLTWGTSIGVLALFGLFVLLFLGEDEGLSRTAILWIAGGSLVLLVVAASRIFFETGTDASLFEDPAYLAALEEFDEGMEVIERSYYCFRDDVCFDPVEGFSWKPKDTPTIFDTIRA